MQTASTVATRFLNCPKITSKQLIFQICAILAIGDGMKQPLPRHIFCIFKPLKTAIHDAVLFNQITTYEKNNHHCHNGNNFFVPQ